MSMRCWFKGNFAYISLLFQITVNNLHRISLIFIHTKRFKYNREIIDGMLYTRSYFLDRKLDLPLNSFKTKADGFCKRSSQHFSLQENRMTIKLSIEWIQSNSIKFKASLFAKHWTYQTVNECINASVVILPIEKYNQQIKLIQLARRRRCSCWCQVLRRYFLLQENEMAVKLSMGIIQSNPKLPLYADIRRIQL